MGSVTQSLVPIAESKDRDRQSLPQSAFFQAILEGLVDGVVVLSDRGEWIHANYKGRFLCRQLAPHSTAPSTVPPEVWRVCQSLLDSRELFPDRAIEIELEVTTNSTRLRLRVRWFQLLESDPPYLLVTLEDCEQSFRNQAIAEGQKYGLTPREAEVWALRRARVSYKEIAAKLYITENTVKKHVKNINAKRQAVLWAEGDRD